MGNRGSKSAKKAVKEQRVDGSYLFIQNRLRYTLMGFERSYQFKILSKQLNNKFSILIHSKINPWFVTGFTDAEGSFSILIYIDKRIKGRLCWAVKPSFQISLNFKEYRFIITIERIFWLRSNY